MCRSSAARSPRPSSSRRSRLPREAGARLTMRSYLRPESNEARSSGTNRIERVDPGEVRRRRPAQAVSARPDGRRAVVVGPCAPRDERVVPHDHPVEFGILDLRYLGELLPRATVRRSEDHVAIRRGQATSIFSVRAIRVVVAEDIDVGAHRHDVRRVHADECRIDLLLPRQPVSRCPDTP